MYKYNTYKQPTASVWNGAWIHVFRLNHVLLFSSFSIMTGSNTINNDKKYINILQFNTFLKLLLFLELPIPGAHITILDTIT